MRTCIYSYSHMLECDTQIGHSRCASCTQAQAWSKLEHLFDVMRDMTCLAKLQIPGPLCNLLSMFYILHTLPVPFLRLLPLFLVPLPF